MGRTLHQEKPMNSGTMWSSFNPWAFPPWLGVMPNWFYGLVVSMKEPFEYAYRISEVLGVDARIHRA
jgi:hypothetical protein